MTMIKRTFCALALWGALTQTGIADNNVHFTGHLVSGACSLVVNGSHLAEVVFQPLNASGLANRRQSARMPFRLQLTECNTALSTGVMVTFSGTEVSGMSGFLALDGQSDASGIGIGIETQAGSQVMINSSSGATFVLVNGLNLLAFNAWVQAINGEEITPGTFSATATVALEYL